MTSARRILVVTTMGIAMASLALVLVFTLLEIVARAFRHPTAWSLDAASYLLCLATVAAMPIVTIEHGHVAVNIFDSFLRPGVARFLKTMVHVLSSLACIAASVLIWRVMASQFSQGITTLTGLVIPKWIITASLLYGFGTSGLIFMLHAVDGLRTVRGTAAPEIAAAE